MPVLVVVVQAVADDEGVRHLEAEIVRLEDSLLTSPFADQDDRLDREDVQGPKLFDQAREGPSGVKDVVEQKYMPALEIGEQVGVDAQLARTGDGPAIARRLDEADLQRQIH